MYNERLGGSTMKYLYTTILLSSLLYGQATYNDNVTAQNLVDKIEGTGLTISNARLYQGHRNQTATFSNGTSSDLAIDEGIYLGGMKASNAFSTNSSSRTSDNFTDIPADDDLLAIDSRATHDTCILEFDVTLDINTRLILVNYQFASEEYNEYVGSIYNDAFGFFVSGGDLPPGTSYNIARVVNPEVFTEVADLENFPPITVNNVNRGSVGSEDTGQTVDLTNSQYFIDNEDGHLDIEFDGLTVGLNATLDNLTPGETYHFKIALADVGDSKYDTGVFINSIQGIRDPVICYDYAYGQNDRYFTEEYDPAEGPRLVGSVLTGTKVDVRMSIQNNHDSEIPAKNVKFSILELDTDVVEYEPDSVYVTNPGELTPTHIEDNSNGMNVSADQILNVPIDDLDAQEKFFVYYSVDPKVGNLDTPLKMKISYDLDLPLSSVQTITLHQSAIVSEETPICSGSNFDYTPKWGTFNIEDASHSGTDKYNLYTQVVNKPFDFNIVTYDKDDINSPKGVNTIVAIELIDASPYHDVNTSCADPESAITKRVWVIVGDGTDNPNAITPISIETAVNEGMTSTTVEDFFGTAKENAAFRISYNVLNEDRALIDWVKNRNRYVIKNFDKLVRDYSRCVNPVEHPRNSSRTTNNVSVACGNAGNRGISAKRFALCNECLYGYNTEVVCSRDNFSIRPEAFKVSIYDNLSSTDESADKIEIEDNEKIAAGYEYRYDLIATSHSGEDPVKGYTRGFGNDQDHNLSFVWTPRSGATDCTDREDKVVQGYLVNGKDVNHLNKANNVGNYVLRMTDKSWTSVDSNPSHHNGHFVEGADCLENTDEVSLSNAKVGCNISNDHTNEFLSKTYSPKPVEIKAYKFDLTYVSFYKGVDDDVVHNNDYVYMNNILDDTNMSSRFNGTIIAAGKDGLKLTNFSKDCYSENVEANVLAAGFNDTNPMLYRLIEKDNTDFVIRDINGSFSSSVASLRLDKNSFRKGVDKLSIHMNIDRDKSEPVEPIEVTFNKVEFRSPDSKSVSEKVRYHTPKSNLDINKSLIYVYGRLNMPRFVRMCDGEAGGCDTTIRTYFEFYGKSQDSAALALKILGENPGRSIDSAIWYINREHKEADGKILAASSVDTVEVGALDLEKGMTSIDVHYDGSNGYPFKDRVYVFKNTGIKDWLIYDPYNKESDRVSAAVEFYGPGKWSSDTGAHTSVQNGDGSNRGKTNRRISW